MRSADFGMWNKDPGFCTTHSAFKWGPWSDSHRRLRVYETRPVAAEAQGQMVSTAGIAPATSAFAGRRSNLTELRGLIKIENEKWKVHNAQTRCPIRGFVLHSAFFTLHLMCP